MNEIVTKPAAVSAKPIDYRREIPGIVERMQGLEGLVRQHGLDKMLLHLVKLRASQINGCGFCVGMRTCGARADGETNERLDRLAA